MNVSLLTSTPVGLLSASPPPSRSATDTKLRQFAPAGPDSPARTHPRESTTADNTLNVAGNRPTGIPPRMDRHQLPKATNARYPQNAGIRPALKRPAPAPNVAEQPSTVQQWLAEYALNKKLDKAGPATKVEPKAGRELTRLLAVLRAEKSAVGPANKAKPAKNKLPLAADRDRAISQVPTKSNKNSGKTQISSEANTTTKSTTTLEGGETSTNEMPSARSTTSSQQTTPPGATELVTKAPARSSNMPGAESTTADAGEKPAITEKAKQVIPVPEDSFQGVLDKSSDPQHNVAGRPIKYHDFAHEPADNKAQTNQQAQILQESLHESSKTRSNSPVYESVLEKLKALQVQVSVGQTKQDGNSTSNNSNNSGLDQIVPPDNPQSPVTQQTSVSSPAPKTTGEFASPSDVPASISKQILESVHSSLRQDDNQITIRLHPPELGKVTIKFQEREDQITGLLEVSKPETRVEIQQALPQIIRNLQDSGVQIKRLDVLLTDQPEQQPSREQLLQDTWSQQQDSENPDGAQNNADGVGTNERLANLNSYPESTEAEVQITDNSINMLI